MLHTGLCFHIDTVLSVLHNSCTELCVDNSFQYNCQNFIIVPMWFFLRLIHVTPFRSSFIVTFQSKAMLSTQYYISPLSIMSMPSIPNHGLDQTIQLERLRFDSWKKANDELRILRVQLMSISKYDPQHGVVSSHIQTLQSLKNQYMDSTTPLIHLTVTPSNHGPLCHDVQSIVNNPPTISPVYPAIHLPLSDPVLVQKNQSSYNIEGTYKITSMDYWAYIRYYDSRPPQYFESSTWC